jgi:hypothetical protein
MGRQAPCHPSCDPYPVHLALVQGLGGGMCGAEQRKSVRTPRASSESLRTEQPGKKTERPGGRRLRRPGLSAPASVRTEERHALRATSEPECERQNNESGRAWNARRKPRIALKWHPEERLMNKPNWVFYQRPSRWRFYRSRGPWHWSLRALVWLVLLVVVAAIWRTVLTALG